MQTLQVTLWMYAVALKRSWECARKNLVVSFAPVAYGVILAIVVSLVAPLGIIGGLLFSLASQACVSSGLFLVKNMVDSDKADFNDFLNGFTVYIWELLGIAFILWIPLRLLAMALATAAEWRFDLFFDQVRALHSSQSGSRVHLSNARVGYRTHQLQL